MAAPGGLDWKSNPTKWERLIVTTQRERRETHKHVHGPVRHRQSTEGAVLSLPLATQL
ncbi:hypothetical protein JOB18_033145 [Solea senegalensis]|uniref:Uncharacterized protein n=1 Tax=Solea senegalensis TaxID=28829 RepID=A0AAV6SHT7_SOLSE|nr:hypothetical protein JOB18_033145 [Solea senegalensis]